MSVEIELPEYDLRALATARDPHAIVEGYRVHIYLRLGILTGVRMCPDCPKCNRYQFGCQDLFGSNMRTMGRVFGGMPELGGATEHQGNGTPHFHAEGRPQHKAGLKTRLRQCDKLTGSPSKTQCDMKTQVGLHTYGWSPARP